VHSNEKESEGKRILCMWNGRNDLTILSIQYFNCALVGVITSLQQHN